MPDTPYLIPISVYARDHDLDPSTVRQKCLRGGWKTAVKVGSLWLISPDEPYTDLRRKPGKSDPQKS